MFEMRESETDRRDQLAYLERWIASGEDQKDVREIEEEIDILKRHLVEKHKSIQLREEFRQQLIRSLS